MAKIAAKVPRSQCVSPRDSALRASLGPSRLLAEVRQACLQAWRPHSPRRCDRFCVKLRREPHAELPALCRRQRRGRDLLPVLRRQPGRGTTPCSTTTITCPTCADPEPGRHELLPQLRHPPGRPAARLPPRAVPGADLPPSATASAAASGLVRLVAVRRDGTDGNTYEVPGEQFDIGRSEGDLLFDDPHMAARHARAEPARRPARTSPRSRPATASTCASASRWSCWTATSS